VAEPERRDDMWVLIEDEGPIVVEMYTDEEASTLGSYWNAVGRYRDNGDTSRLVDFEGVTIAGHRLETDTDEIDFWASRGELSFDSIYES